MADLAMHTDDDADRKDATRRLTNALGELDTGTHTRAHALCVTRLGLLRTTSHDPDEAAESTAWMREMLPHGNRIQSGRLAIATEAFKAAQPQSQTAGALADQPNSATGG